MRALSPSSHFQDKTNCRDQSLLCKDCYKIAYLASTIFPYGSLMLSFNFFGAGALQNHIHCHAWVCPPPSLILNWIESKHTFHGYAVTGAKSSLKQFTLPHGTTIALLKYPCTCIKLLLFIPKMDKISILVGLEEMRKSIATIILLTQVMDVPHNVAWTNAPSESWIIRQSLIAFIFFQSKSQSFIPMDPSMIKSYDMDNVMQCGARKMLQLFHASSKWQLDALSIMKRTMEKILRDVSWEPWEMLWEMVWDE